MDLQAIKEIVDKLFPIPLEFSPLSDGVRCSLGERNGEELPHIKLYTRGEDISGFVILNFVQTFFKLRTESDVIGRFSQIKKRCQELGVYRRFEVLEVEPLQEFLFFGRPISIGEILFIDYNNKIYIPRENDTQKAYQAGRFWDSEGKKIMKFLRPA